MHEGDAQLEAIPFVVFDRAKGYCVTREAEEFLESLGDAQLAPVAVAGKYRTGKSYLINQLLSTEASRVGQRSRGFAVGGTVNACTKGIWLWPQTLKASETQGCEILLIDTEGVGGVGEGQNHDARIFLFALLLSSMFIYNCLGTIDEGELQTIALVTNMAREVRQGEDTELDDQSIAEAFPTFLWLLRDFSLQLVDTQQRTLSPAEYLEAALAPLKGNSDSIEGKNRLRRQFKHFFPRRDCLTLVRPVEREADLQRLEELSPAEVRPEFARNLDKVRKAVLGRARGKTVQGVPVNGLKLLALARVYTQAVNAGRAPNLDLAWNYLAAAENHKLAAILIQRFLATPFSRTDIDQLLQSAAEEFRAGRMGSQPEAAEEERRFLAELRERLVEKASRADRELKAVVKERTRAELDKLRRLILAEELDRDGLEEAMEAAKTRLQADIQAPEETTARLLQKFFHARRPELELLVLSRAELLQRQRLDQAAQQLLFLEEGRNAAELALRDEIDAAEQRCRKAEAELLQENTAVQLRDKTITDLQATVRRLESEHVERAAEEHRHGLEEEQRLQALLAAKREEAQTLRAQLQAAEAEGKKITALAGHREGRLNAELQELREELAQSEGRAIAAQEALTTAALQAERHLGGEIRLREQTARAAALEEKLADFEDLQHNYEKVIKTLSEEKTALERQLEALSAATEQQRLQSLSLLDTISAKIDSIAAQQSSEKPQPQLQRKYDEVKRALAHSSLMQCVVCGKFIGSGLFTAHVGSCAAASAPAAQPPPIPRFTITIGQTLVRDEQRAEGRKSFTEYVMHVESEDRSWYVSRRFREFCELLSELETAMPHLAFPPSCAELWAFLNDIWGLLGGKSIPLEERRKLLQNVMRDLCRVEAVAVHALFRKFVGEAAPKAAA